MNIQNIEKKEKNMATFEVKVPADVFDNAVNEAYKKNKNHLYVAGFRKGTALELREMETFCIFRIMGGRKS